MNVGKTTIRINEIRNDAPVPLQYRKEKVDFGWTLATVSVSGSNADFFDSFLWNLRSKFLSYAYLEENFIGRTVFS